MESLSSRIWTCVAASISYDDYHYTTYIYKLTDRSQGRPDGSIFNTYNTEV